MKKTLPLVICLLAFVLGVGSAVTFAQKAAQLSPATVAVVDVGEVLQNLKQRTSAEAELAEQRERLTQEQNQRRQNIQSLQQDLQVLAAGTEGYEQKRQEAEKAVLDLEVWSRFEQQRLNRDQAVQMESMYRKMLDVISRMSEESGVDLVLFKEAEPSFENVQPQQLGGAISIRKVLYASDKLDLTNGVIQRMNNEFDANR